MMRPMRSIVAAVLAAALGALGPPARAGEGKPAYVQAKAYHILPETHNMESGYFSLCEGLDGRIYVGTAKYGLNAYLVEFDPATETQRIVLDVHKLCGLTAKGYAAQAKIHTRNFVGPSGKVYVGSKQGYPEKGDTSKYPGGYAMAYDPRTGLGEDLSMPLAGQGVIDVVADEPRRLLYVVTCEDQHWMLGDLKTRKYRRLGPPLTPYASTLIDAAGCANALTADFHLARHDPADGKLTTRPILLDGKPFTRADKSSIPTWVLSADARKAWLILMNDPTLIEIDLMAGGETVPAVRLGRMVEGKRPDSRSALALSGDGRLYAVVRVDNETGFGKGHLHHLTRYDPGTRKIDDLGVLAVSNPGYFDFGPGPDGKKPPWSHGFHTLPDGTLTPLYHHMALAAGRDGTLYVTILYPFTLLRIDAFRRPPEPPTPAGLFLDAAGRQCDAVAQRLGEITKLAERVADRHLAGGAIGFAWTGQTLEQELFGRSGNIMHLGFDRPWKADRTDAEKANDVAIAGWDRPPRPGQAKALADLRKRGCHVIGFGSRQMPELAELIPLCDAFIDTGLGADDRVVSLPDGRRVGRANHLVNALNGWAFCAELVAALTRRGRMPTMWKAWAYEDGRAWSEPYFRKKQFHDDYKVAAIPAGRLAGDWLDRIRYLLRRLERTELDHIRQAADLIVAEHRAGRKTVIASTGHMASYYLAKTEDAAWARNIEVHDFVQAQMDAFAKDCPDGALVLRLGYFGMHRDVAKMLKAKRARVIHVKADHPRPEYQPPAGLAVTIDMGYPFGDALVPVEGYPLLLLAPSGVMQVAAYGSLNAEILARIGGPGARPGGDG